MIKHCGIKEAILSKSSRQKRHTEHEKSNYKKVSIYGVKKAFDQIIHIDDLYVQVKGCQKL